MDNPCCSRQNQDEGAKNKCCSGTDQNKEIKWYFKTSNIVIIFLCLGPLALPVVWFNPRFSKKSKIILSVVILILSYFLVILLMKSIQPLVSYYGQMDELMR